MQVNVLMFGPVGDLVGTSCVAQELDDGACVDALARVLIERFPALRGKMSTVRFAVNRSLVHAAHALNDGDEVALIPPVSGG